MPVSFKSPPELVYGHTNKLVENVHQLPRTPLRVGADFLIPSTVVRDLGILIHFDVSMRFRHTIGVDLFFGPASAPYNSPFSVQIRDPVAG